jgi:hypothetical protein
VQAAIKNMREQSYSKSRSDEQAVIKGKIVFFFKLVAVSIGGIFCLNLRQPAAKGI